jgi:hypothetical protein
MYPVRIRYAYVSELDLMALLAGLRLRERWAIGTANRTIPELDARVRVGAAALAPTLAAA